MLEGITELPGADGPLLLLVGDAPRLRVPHSCVLCKGGNHGPIPLKGLSLEYGSSCRRERRFVEGHAFSRAVRAGEDLRAFSP